MAASYEVITDRTFVDLSWRYSARFSHSDNGRVNYECLHRRHDEKIRYQVARISMMNGEVMMLGEHAGDQIAAILPRREKRATKEKYEAIKGIGMAERRYEIEN